MGSSVSSGEPGPDARWEDGGSLQKRGGGSSGVGRGKQTELHNRLAEPSSPRGWDDDDNRAPIPGDHMYRRATSPPRSRGGRAAAVGRAGGGGTGRNLHRSGRKIGTATGSDTSRGARAASAPAVRRSTPEELFVARMGQAERERQQVRNAVIWTDLKCHD